MLATSPVLPVCPVRQASPADAGAGAALSVDPSWPFGCGLALPALVWNRDRLQHRRAACRSRSAAAGASGSCISRHASRCSNGSCERCRLMHHPRGLAGGRPDRPVDSCAGCCSEGHAPLLAARFSRARHAVQLPSRRRCCSGHGRACRARHQGPSACSRRYPGWLALDSASYGADRAPMLRDQIERFPDLALVASDPSGVLGFALALARPRQTVIGPMVTSEAASAMTLTAALLARTNGAIRCGSLCFADSQRAADHHWLEERGLAVLNRIQLMLYGPERGRTPFPIPHRLFAAQSAAAGQAS
jgi:hypothetical protein